MGSEGAWSNQLVNLIILAAQSLGFSGFFVYNPAPGAGNLVLSITGAAGTDPYANPYPTGLTVGKASQTQIQLFSSPAGVGVLRFLLNNAGFTNGQILSGVVSGPPNFGSVTLNGPANTAAGFTDFVGLLFNSSDGVSSFANASFEYNDIASAVHTYMSVDGSGVNVTTGSIAGIAPGTGTNQSTPAVRGTWQTLSLSNASGSGNNVNGFFYRVMGEVDEGRNPFVYMIWDISVSANSPSTIGTVASGYAPAETITWPTGWYGNGPAAYTRTFAPRLQINSSGQVSTQGGVLSGMDLAGFAIYPIGSP